MSSMPPRNPPRHPQSMRANYYAPLEWDEHEMQPMSQPPRQRQRQVRNQHDGIETPSFAAARPRRTGTPVYADCVEPIAMPRPRPSRPRTTPQQPPQVPQEDQLPHHTELSTARLHERARARLDVTDDQQGLTQPRRTYNPRAHRSTRQSEHIRRNRPSRADYEELGDLENQAPRRTRAQGDTAAVDAPTEPVDNTPSGEPSRTHTARWLATGAGAVIGLVNPMIAAAASSNANDFGSEGTAFMLKNGITIGSILVGTLGLGGVGYAEMTKIGLGNKIGIGFGTGLGMLSGIINAGVNTESMTAAVVINYIAVGVGVGGLLAAAGVKKIKPSISALTKPAPQQDAKAQRSGTRGKADGRAQNSTREQSGTRGKNGTSRQPTRSGHRQGGGQPRTPRT